MPRAGVTAASLTHLAAQAQPRHRPVFSEGTDLVGIADAAQSVELLLITRVAIADQGDGGAELERANIDDAEAEAVARPRKARRHARFPDAEQRQSGQAEFAVAGARPRRKDAAFADGDDPSTPRRIGAFGTCGWT